ncbi:MAG: type II toxin-antitoxin system HicB family antitoxin [Parvibaculum sp.]
MSERSIGLTLAYPARITNVEGEYLVGFVDFPEALTSGNTEDEAFEMACDALNVTIAGYIKDGTPIPEPSVSKRGEYLVPVDPNVAAKAFLSDALRSRGMNQSDLARSLDIDTRNVQRLLDPTHSSTLSSISEALKHVGLSITMTLVDTGPNRRMLRSAKSGSGTAHVLRPMKAIRGRPARTKTS